jgi:hypothetical protein
VARLWRIRLPHSAGAIEKEDADVFNNHRPSPCPRRPGGGRFIALGPSKRFAEFEAGNLSRAELFAWAARYPEEVPLVNGELPWIGLRLADLD